MIFVSSDRTSINTPLHNEKISPKMLIGVSDKTDAIGVIKVIRLNKKQINTATGIDFFVSLNPLKITDLVLRLKANASSLKVMMAKAEDCAQRSDSARPMP